MNLLLVFSIQADINPDLNQIRAVLNRAKDMQPQECPGYDPGIKDYLIVFDGKGAFYPLTPAMRAPYFENKISIEEWIDSSPERKNDKEWIYWKKLHANSHSNIQTRSLIPAMFYRHHIQEDLAVGRKLLYYSKDDDKTAFECVQKIYTSSTQNQSTKPPYFRVMGYSMGGDAAISFARMMKEAQIPLDTGLTIDPVGRGMKWTSGVISGKNGQAGFDVTGLFQRKWMNVYQKLDHGSVSLLFKIGIRGSSVKGATKDIDATETLRANHTNLENPDDKFSKISRNKIHVLITDDLKLIRPLINEWLYP